MGQVIFLNPSDIDSIDEWVLQAAAMRVAAQEIIEKLYE